MRLFGISLKSLLPWQLASRIRMLTLVLGRFGKGDLSQKAPISQDDLIGRLGIKLNEIADSLSSQMSALRLERLQLETIIGSMSEGMAVTDANGTVTKANPAWYRIFNSSPSGLGRPILESARVPQIFDIINEAVTKKSAQELEFGIGERTFVARAVPFEIGGEQGCVTVISDVSKLKQMETMRRDFTANVSHQMKTPLTSILGYSETLLRMNEDDRASVKAFARTIHDQGTKLKELIDDILELARIESPRHGPDVTSVELKDVVDVVAREFQKNDKGITFALNVPNTVIMSDAKDVRHIFHNLMDNAVKFSPRGAVVEVLGRANGKTVEVSVRDFGPGIPEDELGRIFERFYRVPSAGSISPEGSGLGLAIAKHLTERLGGAIKAESVEGSGSTFTVTLPG